MVLVAIGGSPPTGVRTSARYVVRSFRLGPWSTMTICAAAEVTWITSMVHTAKQVLRMEAPEGVEPSPAVARSAHRGARRPGKCGRTRGRGGHADQSVVRVRTCHRSP